MNASLLGKSGSRSRIENCPACPPHTHGSGTPSGCTCSCGRHFHFGDELWGRTDRCITCPSCRRSLSPLDFDMHGEEIATMAVVDDHATVRQYLSDWGDASWAKPDNAEYVESVVARMLNLRAEHPSGEYPAPVHGQDDVGACEECDALRCLARQADDA